MLHPKTVARCALALALLAAPLANAKDFAKSYANSADRTFDAIMRLVQSDDRVHMIDYSAPDRLVQFRLALDPSDPASPLDQFSGMWVLLQVSNTGERVTVNLRADRIYPPQHELKTREKTRGNTRAEETTFAKDFWKQLERELKR